MDQTQQKASKRKNVIGVVTSDRMDKTITVRSGRTVKHPRYGKYVKRYTTYYAHDEKGRAKIGDKVVIGPTRPLSKKKNWLLVEVLESKGEL